MSPILEINVAQYIFSRTERPARPYTSNRYSEWKCRVLFFMLVQPEVLK